MSNKSTEKYLDNLLNTINSSHDVTDIASDIENASPADQDEFLREFESELDNETYDDYLNSFERELDDDEEKAAGVTPDIQTSASDENDATLDEMLSDFDRRMKEEENSSQENPQNEMEQIGDAAEQFDPEPQEESDSLAAYDGTEKPSAATADDADDIQVNTIDEIGEPDLGGNASKDLLDILDSKDLEDIGQLLEGKTDDADGGDGSEIDNYAKDQMQAHESTDDTAASTTDSGKKADKKLGFFKRLFSFLTKEPQDDSEQTAANGADADAKTLSDENQQILDELEQAEAKANGGKKKPKKEKKPKEPKAPKAKKEPKPKKEKKPKTPWEKGPKLPKGPVILICIFVASLVVLVLICTFLLGNSSKVTDAQNTYNEAMAGVSSGDGASIELYSEAYSKISGLKLSGDDEKLANKLSVLAAVSDKYDSYVAFDGSGYVSMAADSLVCAAGRCEVNADNAKEYGCETELENLKNIISDTLNSKYGISYEDAVSLYNISDRDEYTLALSQKLKDLGLNEETN